MKIKEYNQACAIWLQFKDKLQHYILKKVKDQACASEINHEVLNKLLRACCAEREIKNLSSWLFQIAHNATIDYLKTRIVNSGLEEFEIEAEAEGTQSIYTEMSRFIEPLLNFLPDKYAVPLKMVDLEKQKFEQVSQKLGLSLAATKSRVQRGRKMLKAEIETCFHLEKIGEYGLSDFALKSCCKPLQAYKTGYNDD